MFDVGFLELLAIGIIALIVLGPERLPAAARTVGLWVGRTKRLVRNLTSDIDRQLQAEELRAKIKQEGGDIGLNEINESVQAAVDKAKDFEHLVNQPSTSSNTDPQSTKTDQQPHD